MLNSKAVVCLPAKFKEFCKSEKLNYAKFFEFCYLCAVGKGKCVKIRYEPYTKPLSAIIHQ